MTDKELADEIGDAARLLDSLTTEQTALPAEIRSAQEIGDVPAMIRHRKRAGEIGLHVNAAQIKLLRLEIISLESEHEAAKIAAADAREKLPAAEALFTAARAAFDRSNAGYLHVSEHARSFPGRIGQAKLRLDILQREQSAA